MIFLSMYPKQHKTIKSIPTGFWPKVFLSRRATWHIFSDLSIYLSISTEFLHIIDCLVGIWTCRSFLKTSHSKGFFQFWRTFEWLVQLPILSVPERSTLTDWPQISCDCVGMVTSWCCVFPQGPMQEETGRDHPGNEGHFPRDGVVPVPSQLWQKRIL